MTVTSMGLSGEAGRVLEQAERISEVKKMCGDTIGHRPSRDRCPKREGKKKIRELKRK